jgi:murein DD-endopeptidase MepM/ murein hydrolase activator NlpD
MTSRQTSCYGSVSMLVDRRWAILASTLALLALPTGAGAAPAAPAQEEASDDRAPGEFAMVGVESLSVESVTASLGELHAEVGRQLGLLGMAQQAVATANQNLADADVRLSEVRFRIDETTNLTDAIVIDQFVNPPAASALDVLSAETTEDATVKQAILDMQADEAAGELERHEATLAELEVLEAEQQAAREAAEAAREEAEATLADLNAALSNQARFVTAVQTALASEQQAAPPGSPEEQMALATRINEITAAMTSAQEAREIAEAQAAIEAANARRLAMGGLVCPVDGPVTFTNTWGAPRSGGRTHKGVDMLAARGTPTVAPVSGEVVHRSSSLGGLSWYVYGDNGNTYYGTHLSRYENQGAGWVEAGTTIGYVGDSGNAAGTPHLHFEVHPGGGAPVNPYPYVAEAC